MSGEPANFVPPEIWETPGGTLIGSRSIGDGIETDWFSINPTLPAHVLIDFGKESTLPGPKGEKQIEVVARVKLTKQAFQGFVGMIMNMVQQSQQPPPQPPRHIRRQQK